MTEGDITYSGVDYKFRGIPVYVGYYQLGGVPGVSFSFAKKPNWFHRKMMALCLGFVWFDGSPFK